MAAAACVSQLLFWLYVLRWQKYEPSAGVCAGSQRGTYRGRLLTREAGPEDGPGAAISRTGPASLADPARGNRATQDHLVQPRARKHRGHPTSEITVDLGPLL